MNDPTPKKPDDPRRRLRELLAIPERDRTDAQWDELAALEVELAPGNRIDQGRRERPPQAPQRPPGKGHGPPQRGGGKKPQKKPGGGR